MATDKSLATLLRALQRASSEQDASRLLASATTIFTLLANPLNITLLTSQLLGTPAIWQGPASLQTSLQLLGVFNSASRHIQNREQNPDVFKPDHTPVDSISHYKWARAVANGADEKSPRWKHLLVLGGLLCSLREAGGGGATSLRHNLEMAVVDAANAALLDEKELNNHAAGSICLSLGHAFPSLEPTTIVRLRGDLLLPILTHQLLRSREGLQWGYFLGIADHDVVQVGGRKFSWSPSSTSFYQLQKLSKSPLISCLGSLAQLWARCVGSTSNVESLRVVMEDLVAFSRSLSIQWRQNKLSEVDRTEENEFLDTQTLSSSIPLLWQVLRSVVFTCVVVLQAVLGRVLHDGAIPPPWHGDLARQSLLVLRNLYFVSSRMGHHAFGQYTFVYMAAIDVLSRYPTNVEAFLVEIKPRVQGSIPEHPHDRCLDLFFFNTAEHFTLLLSPTLAEPMLLGATKPYLNASLDSRLIDSFEAAHSLVLSVFSCPSNVDLTARHLPAYVNTVLSTFPGNLSSRQFRLAIKTLVRVVSPPTALSQVQPLLASAILEAVLARCEASTENVLPAKPAEVSGASETTQLSEKAALMMTLIDSLPALSVDSLEDWLPIVAAALRNIEDLHMRELCRTRMWEIISNGEMDVPRAEVCVAWWNDQAGRQMVLGQNTSERTTPMMSGALPEASRL